MANRLHRLGMAACVICVGCGPFWTPLEPDPTYVTIRASSLPYLGLVGSTRHVPRRTDAVRDELTTLFDKRGYHLSTEYVAADESRDTVYKFVSAPPTSITLSIPLGSAFFVTLHAAGPRQSDVVIVGKPLLPNGPSEVCSDADQLLRRFGYGCSDLQLRCGEGLAQLLTGRTEAEVARGVLQELGDWAAG